MVEGHVSARTWRFKSSHPHHSDQRKEESFGRSDRSSSHWTTRETTRDFAYSLGTTRAMAPKSARRLLLPPLASLKLSSASAALRKNRIEAHPLPGWATFPGLPGVKP